MTLHVGRKSAGVLLVLVGALRSSPVGAQPSPGPTGSSEPAPASVGTETCVPLDRATDEQRLACARQRFDDGIRLAGQTRWAEAVQAFREAAENRDSPVVQLNVGYCLRALGHYVAARQAVRRALRQSSGLSPEEQEQARGYEAEFEAIVARIAVELEPPDAALSVDGRPLRPSSDEPGLLLGGVAPPGDPVSPKAKSFTVQIDPGHHVFRATRPGRADVVVARTVRSGERMRLDLRLDRLPATVVVTSSPAQALVRAGGREVGVTPIELERPAGKLRLEVLQDGFEPYESELDLAAGQRADLAITLRPVADDPLWEQWWFWTIIGAGLGGAVLGTYFGVTESAEPPPYDGGSLGWVASPIEARF